MALPHKPPLLPQLARPAKTLPVGDGWAYEPKWDGFRAIAFVDGTDVYLQSRSGKPLRRYFPELTFPEGRYILDGEIVLFDADGRQDFDALGQRIHPAESRIAMLAEQTPTTFVAFDLLALDDESLLGLPQRERRDRLVAFLSEPLQLCDSTTDPAQAEPWLEDREGVIAKRQDARYEPGKRVGMSKIKRVRTIDAEGRQDFDALGQRIHPAETRINMLAEQTPTTFVAFDLLALDDESLLELPQHERRSRLVAFLSAPLQLCDSTTDPAEAEPWLEDREGVIAKRRDAKYEPGKRVGMSKIKRVRTIDAVVQGWRPGKEEGTVGSLILGLYDGDGNLVTVGHTSGISRKEKGTLPAKLAPYETGERGMGDPSRWDNARDLEWIALRPELVIEITFDHTSNDRIRHGTKLVRWRDDKKPEECLMEQLKS